MYLIETKAVHSSAFPTLSYLKLVLSTILIRSTTWIRWRPGICGLQARARVTQPPRSQDCEKLGGSLGTRLRTHLICGWLGTRLLFDRWVKYGVLFVLNNSNAPTQAWWGQSITSWDRSFTLWGRSVTLWSWSANSCWQPSWGVAGWATRVDLQLESIINLSSSIPTASFNIL